jgi:hypothetical protein
MTVFCVHIFCARCLRQPDDLSLSMMQAIFMRSHLHCGVHVLPVCPMLALYPMLTTGAVRGRRSSGISFVVGQVGISAAGVLLALKAQALHGRYG